MCLDTFKKSVQPSLLVLTLLPNFIYKKKANLLLILGLFFIHLCLFQSRCWVSVWVQTSGLQLCDGWREVEAWEERPERLQTFCRESWSKIFLFWAFMEAASDSPKDGAASVLWDQT